MINHGMLGQHFWDSGDLLGIDPSWGSTRLGDRPPFFLIFQVVLEIGDGNARPSRRPISSNIQEPGCEYICPICPICPMTVDLMIPMISSLKKS